MPLPSSPDVQERQRGDDFAMELQVTLVELYGGASKSLTIKRRAVCKGCKHAHARDTPRCRRCGDCPNELRRVNVQIAPGFVMPQMQEVRSDEKCEDRATTIDAEIVAGMKEGDELVFARMSEQRPGAIPGDVRLRLKLERDRGSSRGFERKGDDLHTELHVPLKAALLGFATSLIHLDGHLVRVSADGVTQPMQVLKVRGEGMPRRGAEPPRNGTLHVKVVVDLPERLTPELEKLAKKLPDPVD